MGIKLDQARAKLIAATTPPQAARPGGRPQADPMRLMQMTLMRIEQRQIQQNEMLAQVLQRLPPDDAVGPEDEASDEETAATDTADEPRSA